MVDTTDSLNRSLHEIISEMAITMMTIENYNDYEVDVFVVGYSIRSVDSLAMSNESTRRIIARDLH
jgi:nicotinate-nucleotide pyrophosphorylase